MRTNGQVLKFACQFSIVVLLLGFQNLHGQAPTVTGFTPTSGLVGTTVIINGTNFSTTPANNDVQFNGTSATVTLSSATSITCTVPAGASTGPITVTVAGLTGTSTANFAVTTASITITTQPSSVTACDGQVVTFTTAATGTTNITYQWQIEDPDGDWINVTDGGGYSGATTAVLTVNTAGTFGEGTYQCLISGDFAIDVNSNDVFLDIGPNAPAITDAVRCGPGTVTVVASGGTSGQYRWYTQASGGTPILGEVNATFTTPFLTGTTLYYVAINNGTCESPRSIVQVGISTCQPQPGFVWGQGMGVGTMANGLNGGYAILIDSDGNLLVCGGFQGTIDFDNGPGTAILTAGGNDSFLLKMTPAGTLLWAKGIGGPGNDSVGGMSIDGAGNIYMLFEFSGTSDFDPGVGVSTLTSTPSTPANKSDLAVAKYDRDGNFIWVRLVGGNNDERTGGLKADSAGNVYITGSFRGTTNFNGSFPRTALGTNSTDVFFAKMDTNGSFLWAGSIGSPLATAANLFSDDGRAIEIDGSGNVYVSGVVYGPTTTVDFDPSAGTAPQTIIDRAGFILKLNSSGVYQTHYSIEGGVGNAVSIDASNNVYFTGAFSGTVDIDPGSGVLNVTGNGANYITKLNASGNFVWGKMLVPGGFGVTPTVLTRGIVFDAAGDLYVTGYNTAGATDFDLGPLEEARGLNGLFVLNPFVWKLNSNGDFNWVIDMRRISGGLATASYASVAVSATGDIFTTGSYARNVDLDPGLCQFSVTNLNGQDIFISRLSSSQPNVCFAQQPVNVSACANDIVSFTTGIVDTGSIFYQWQKLNTATSKYDYITNGGGYSGTTSATLTINTTGNFGAGVYRCKVSGTSTVGGFSDPATLSFFSNTSPLTTGASGCSLSTLTVSASGGINGQYRWYTEATGGAAISGEVNSLFVTPVLTSTTTYYVSLTNGTCESLRTPVVATINSLPPPPTTTNTSNCGPGSVTLNASGASAGQYRWYSVATGGSAITGETSSTLTTPLLSVTTTYYVSINDGTCESNRTAVVATINDVPTAPAITGASSCGPGSVTLNASGASAGQYRWYTLAAGGVAISGETNASLSISNLTTTTTYYVSISNGTCESSRTAVNAVVNNPPLKPVISSSEGIAGGITIICQSPITLTAPPGFAVYSWSTGATTSSILINTATANITLRVTDSNGCQSPTSDPLQVTRNAACTNQPPAITPTSVSTSIGSKARVVLTGFVSDPDNNLDLTTLRVVAVKSGAPAIIQNQTLEVEYAGVNFSGTDEVTIEVCDLNKVCTTAPLFIEVIGDVVVYNGISANGDTQNVALVFQYINAIAETRQNRVSIFNRWGDLVWEGVNYDNINTVFVGQSKDGKDLPSGTYFYKVEFTNSTRAALTGYLSLKR